MGTNARKARQYLIMLLLASTVLITGCWDRREIEDLGIVVGIAIDKPKQTVAGKREMKEAFEHRYGKRQRITITQQFVVPGVFGGQEGKGSSEKKPYVNISSEGDTVLQVIRQYSTVASRPPYYEHLKAIVIGEDVARSINLQKLLDFFLRDHEFRRNVKIVIAEESARAVLEAQPQIEDLPAFRLLKLTENTYKTSRMPPVLSMGDMSEKMAAGSSFLMQRVVARGNDVKLGGAAVIKGKSNRLVGWLGEEEIDGLNWLSGKVKGGVVEAVDEQTKEMVVYEIHNTKSSIKPRVEGEKISFTVEIESEGRLSEDWNLKANAFDEKYLKRACRAVEAEVGLLVGKALEKTQKEFKVDVAGFGKQLSIKYPKVWQKVKNDWDQLFSKVPIEVRIKIYIRQFGTKAAKK